MWFQTECAIAFQRMGKWGEALKKCHEVERVSLHLRFSLRYPLFQPSLSRLYLLLCTVMNEISILSKSLRINSISIRIVCGKWHCAPMSVFCGWKTFSGHILSTLAPPDAPSKSTCICTISHFTMSHQKRNCRPVRNLIWSSFFIMCYLKGENYKRKEGREYLTLPTALSLSILKQISYHPFLIVKRFHHSLGMFCRSIAHRSCDGNIRL